MPTAQRFVVPPRESVPFEFTSNDLSGIYIPGRGLPFSILLHGIVLTVMLFSPIEKSPKEPYVPLPQQQAKTLEPDRVEEVMWLPTIGLQGKAAGEPTAVETKTEGVPSPPREGLVYPGRQEIRSEFPAPTNQLQTLLQPDLEELPLERPAVKLPNLVSLSDFIAPQIKPPTPLGDELETPEPEEPPADEPAPLDIEESEVEALPTVRPDTALPNFVSLAQFVAPQLEPPEPAAEEADVLGFEEPETTESPEEGVVPEEPQVRDQPGEEVEPLTIDEPQKSEPAEVIAAQPNEPEPPAPAPAPAPEQTDTSAPDEPVEVEKPEEANIVEEDQRPEELPILRPSLNLPDLKSQTDFGFIPDPGSPSPAVGLTDTTKTEEQAPRKPTEVTAVVPEKPEIEDLPILRPPSQITDRVLEADYGFAPLPEPQQAKSDQAEEQPMEQEALPEQSEPQEPVADAEDPLPSTEQKQAEPSDEQSVPLDEPEHPVPATEQAEARAPVTPEPSQTRREQGSPPESTDDSDGEEKTAGGGGTQQAKVSSVATIAPRSEKPEELPISRPASNLANFLSNSDVTLAPQADSPRPTDDGGAAPEERSSTGTPGPPTSPTTSPQTRSDNLQTNPQSSNLGNIVALSPTPASGEGPVEIPPGQAKGQFTISPEGNLDTTATEPGVADGDPSSEVRFEQPPAGNKTVSDEMPTVISVSFGSPPTDQDSSVSSSGEGGLAASAGGKSETGTSSEPTNSRFSGITVIGGVGGGMSPTDSPPAFVQTARPLQTEYGLFVVSTESSGGGLPSFGVFEGQPIQTVYLDMRETETDTAPSWVLEFAIPEARPLSTGDSEQSVEGVELPFPAFKEQPVLPIELVRKHLDRMIIVFTIINEEGRLEELSIKESPDPLLNDPLIEALKGWVFQPARLNGEPISIKALLGIPLWIPPEALE